MADNPNYPPNFPEGAGKKKQGKFEIAGLQLDI
jgi:hypothetical protein